MSKILLCMTAAAAALSLGSQAMAANPKTTPATKPPPATSTPSTSATPSTSPPATTPTPDPTMPSTPPTTSTTPTSPMPGAPETAPTGTPSDTSASAPAPAGSFTVGLAVKDNTGAQIGQITEVKTDAAGAQMATITMGTDVFAVPTSKLAVANGAATINLTQAQIKQMLPAKTPPPK